MRQRRVSGSSESADVRCDDEPLFDAAIERIATEISTILAIERGKHLDTGAGPSHAVASATSHI